MALYRDPKTVLLETIEQRNNITLDPVDYDFSEPVPVSPPPGSSAVYNTAITVTANNVAAPYQGDYDFYYNRLDFAELESMVDFYIRSPGVATSHDVIDPLNRRFGLSLTTDDIELLDTVDMGGYYEVLIKAKTTSIGWIGEATLRLSEGGLDLGDFIFNTELGGLQYPTPYPSKTFAVMYSYWRDFSAHTETLKSYATEGGLDQVMVNILQDVTGDPWQLTGQADYSLSNAVISFAGVTDDISTVNNDYDYAIIIDLNIDDCLEMTGQLILHFNEPEDPNALDGGIGV